MCRSHSLLFGDCECKEKSELQHAHQVHGAGATGAGTLSTTFDDQGSGLQKLRPLHPRRHAHDKFDSQVHVLPADETSKGGRG